MFAKKPKLASVNSSYKLSQAWLVFSLWRNSLQRNNNFENNAEIFRAAWREGKRLFPCCSKSKISNSDAFSKEIGLDSIFGVIFCHSSPGQNWLACKLTRIIHTKP